MPPLDRPPSWKWVICGLLFLATLLNYMDRQALSTNQVQIANELHTNADHYGNLEMAFGLAFACGGLLFGVLADRVNVWLLYPIVLVGWSVAGYFTGSSEVIGGMVASGWKGLTGQEVSTFGLPPESSHTYLGLLVCRIVLGLFEAGQWPCALVTTRRLLTAEDRTLGNSLLQSGASIGAIVTPIVTRLVVQENVTGSWQGLFRTIGALGLLWIVPWMLMIRPRDLAPEAEIPTDPLRSADFGKIRTNPYVLRQYLVAVCVVIMINLNWHFFRAWMPTFLQSIKTSQPDGQSVQVYSRDFVLNFLVAYYLATDVGCLAVGYATKALAARGWSVHWARTATFAACSLLTGLGVFAGMMPASPLLLAVLLTTGMGALGLFPTYYSLTQDLSSRNQGKITGSLSALTWCCTAAMQKFVGKSVEASGSYTLSFIIVSLAPLVALVAILLFWKSVQERAEVLPA